ncbi:hypothetical protein BH09PSE4_BH09PSE4_21270 [soil metagenome]
MLSSIAPSTPALPGEALRSQVAVPLLMAASSATSSTFVVPGPETVVFFGVAVPVLSALFGLVGVALGQIIAPPTTAVIGWRRRSAVVVALLGIVLSTAIATGQQPLVVFSWGIGLGFAGNTIVETLGSQAVSGVRKVTDAFLSMIAAKVGGANPKDSDNG